MPREFAKVADVKIGSKLQTDDSFSCTMTRHTYDVMYDEEQRELYFLCDIGRHFFEIQKEGDVYIGIYLVEERT